jgi:hypothetical protein
VIPFRILGGIAFVSLFIILIMALVMIRKEVDRGSSQDDEAEDAQEGSVKWWFSQRW